MKKLFIITLLAIFLWSIPASAQLIFIYGDSKEKVALQMLPKYPDNKTSDAQGFEYLHYRFSDLYLMFQFFNNRLVGVIIAASTPKKSPRMSI